MGDEGEGRTKWVELREINEKKGTDEGEDVRTFKMQKTEGRWKEVWKRQRAGGDEGTGGGISHSETETWPPLAKMKGYFNWVSDACLILFSILIPYNVHNQNKHTHGCKAVNRKQ